jgi:hypothetical protein
MLLGTVSGNESFRGKQFEIKQSIACQCEQGDLSGNCGYRTGGYTTAKIICDSQMTWCQ